MREKLPDWFTKEIVRGKKYFQVIETLKELNLNTVCEKARCPNRGECCARGTAAFLIMGNVCARFCRFCAVQKGVPKPLEKDEPKRIAEAIGKLGLKYAVITSVTRDDLEDDGASHFARTIREIRWENPLVKIEVLIPDFQGSTQALKIVLDARPDVLNHNLETAPRLYRTVRPKADYKKSLQVLLFSKIIEPKILTKSGLMLGLGETREEILEVLKDLRENECDFLTLGQYLAPSKKHLPVKRFVAPEEFENLKKEALNLGFKAVAAGPLVRSSYLADRLFNSKVA